MYNDVKIQLGGVLEHQGQDQSNLGTCIVSGARSGV